MDFTYIFALILSVLIGFASAVVFVAFRGQSYWRLVSGAVILALVADFSLLIDWTHTAEMTPRFLLTEGAFFLGYGLVGVIVGVLPVIGSRWIYRTVRAERPD